MSGGDDRPCSNRRLAWHPHRSLKPGIEHAATDDNAAPRSRRARTEEFIMQSRSFHTWRLIRTRWLPVSLLLAVAITTMASNALAINRNVAPSAIEIDS